MTDPGSLRAADVDRETVVRALTEQMSAGRLSMGEFDERCQAVYAAKTYADLVPITADLPLPSPLVNPPGWVPAQPGGAVGVPPQSRGSRAEMPSPRTGHRDATRSAAGPQYGVPSTIGEQTEVVGRSHQHPRPGEGYGRHYPFGWRSGLSGYLVTVLVMVVIWAVAGFGHFWPGWFLFFGLFWVFGSGKHGRRGCR